MSSKTGKEARAERATWFSLVFVFILLSFDEDLTIPDYIVPFTVAGILIFSGFYQLRRKWSVSPILWMVAALMIAAGIYGVYFDSLVDLRLVALIATVAIIVFGVVTNES